MVCASLLEVVLSWPSVVVEVEVEVLSWPSVEMGVVGEVVGLVEVGSSPWLTPHANTESL